MIETDHLHIVPHAPEHLLSLIEDPARYEAMAGFAAAPGLREFFVSGELSPAFLESLRTLEGPDPWRIGFVLIDRQSRTAVGTAGFKGPPDADGMVEVAYGVVPAFEGRGYATEAAAALVAYAFESGLVRTVRAHTLPAPNASTRVLRKCGFEFIGDVVEPDDGPVWRWERAGER